MTQAIDQATVIQYLLDNPDFFQKNAGILPEMHLTSPILGKTVSLHERQMEVMRMWWLFLLGLMLGGTVVMCLFQIKK